MQPKENAATIVTLFGAGPATIEGARALAARSAILLAVDGGVEHALRAKLRPDMILGDFDSLPAILPPDLADVPRRHMRDQDSTDFDKALRSVEGDLYLCAGFLDGRTDHTLACFHSLLKRPERRAILVSQTDLVTLLPPRLALNMPAGARVSVFPMKPASARSTGLRWPLDGLALGPDETIATSNAATGGPVVIESDAPHLLLILPAAYLDQLIASFLQCTQGWSD